ncbi:Zn(II)2Cys6 transcription factor [Pochonia chlamydosporia 170]|uniref:Zn(II)2Cys6 transcription factor n=1 Tax=Pochonia chlamydosporia 170 TaxID=1380566 RepID=A0A179F5D0_METCM|nr:Zn(II)2Cys6 transcription factor [Pochonia chlamydosporia 170]OAQ60612.1 Zn(II)2Cys6 transcription factor [Pochonia chlamydosporia 170]
MPHGRQSTKRSQNGRQTFSSRLAIRTPKYVIQSTFGDFCRSRDLPCQAIASATRRTNHQVPSSSETTQSASLENQPTTSPDFSKDSIHSLENNNGHSTYCIGPAAEQDSHLLDTFRYAILNEGHSVDGSVVPIYPGTQNTKDRPVHFLFLTVEHTEAATRSRIASSDAIEALVGPHGDALVRLYLKHIHPVFPILPKVHFLKKYATDRNSVPACLRGAIYATASVFWKDEPSLNGPCPFEQHQILDHAHASLRREIENPNLLSVTACLLLIHATPPEMDTVETPTTWTLSAQATAAAQLIGLHQDPGEWKIPQDEKHMRRKLWWATYVTDCLASVSYGNPPHIGAGTFSTMDLSMEDVRCNEDVPAELRYLIDDSDGEFDVSTGARFLELVRVTMKLRAILDSSFRISPTGDVPSKSAKKELVDIQRQLREWESLRPSCLNLQRRKPQSSSYNCPIHMVVYATKVLLYRALMHPATRHAKTTPGSNLKIWFSAALSEFEAFTEYLSSITAADLNGFWGRHARSQLVSCANFLIYLFLMASEKKDVERAYALLEDFATAAEGLKAVASFEANIFLRPASLRVESFFAQAAEIMRNGHGGDIP